MQKRGVPSETAMRVLDGLAAIVRAIDANIYLDMKQQAPQRIAQRDADDCPVPACAMSIGRPVWTEDADFFGTGVATWTTDRVALYFA
jgi:predicted nucleic acid-binding protein